VVAVASCVVNPLDRLCVVVGVAAEAGSAVCSVGAVVAVVGVLCRAGIAPEAPGTVVVPGALAPGAVVKP
jgi:hypothetical protein